MRRHWHSLQFNFLLVCFLNCLLLDEVYLLIEVFNVFHFDVFIIIFRKVLLLSYEVLLLIWDDILLVHLFYLINVYSIFNAIFYIIGRWTSSNNANYWDNWAESWKEWSLHLLNKVVLSTKSAFWLFYRSDNSIVLFVNRSSSTKGRLTKRLRK